MNQAYAKMTRQLEIYEEAYNKNPSEYLRGKLEAFKLGMAYKRVDLLSKGKAETMPNLDKELI